MRVTDFEFEDTDMEFEEAEAEREFEEEMNKKEASQTTEKDVKEIMEMFEEGKKLFNPAESYFKHLYRLKKKDKIKTEMFFGKRPEAAVPEEFNQMVLNYQKGNELMCTAKADMIEKLDMFIYYIIGKKFSTFKRYTKDLYQEGVVGILKGIDTFDPEKGKATTYFYTYILHEMTEFVNTNINKTTSHYSANIVKVKKAINHFEKDGRDWTITDLAQETGISAETIAQALNIMESANEIHYETPDYLDVHTSENFSSPEEEYLKREVSKMLQDAIDSLSVDEANVIRLKFGLTGEEPLSYKNISIRLGIQIDRVKKLNSSAIRKLKRNKVISGNFKTVSREEKILNESFIGVVPVKVGESIMDELDEIFAAEELTAAEA